MDNLPALEVLAEAVLADIMVVLMARLEVLILAAAAAAVMVEILVVDLVVLVLLFFVWQLLTTQAQQVVHLQLQQVDQIQY